MARLGQLCVSFRLAFLVAAVSVTACSSTGDTPAAEPVPPTAATTTQISADVTEPTTEPSNLVKLCTAAQSWGLSVAMLSIGPWSDAISDIWRGNEITVEEINEQLDVRLRNSVITVVVSPDAYMSLLIEILSLLAEVMDGSLSDELQEFAEAYSEFIGERVRTFDFDNSTVNLSSLYMDDLPNMDVVIEECGFPMNWSDSG